MALVDVHKIMLRNTAASHGSFVFIHHSSFAPFELNPDSYGEQSIDFYSYPYSNNLPDEICSFVFRAALGNSEENYGLVPPGASLNLDIYFYTSDTTVYRGKITMVNVCKHSDGSVDNIHCEFCLYHDRRTLPAMAFDKLLPKRNAPRSVPGIERIIFNDPATIVFWTDGTKTVVKAHDEEFSEEHGLAMAMARKLLECRGCEFPRAEFKRLVRENGKR